LEEEVMTGMTVSLREAAGITPLQEAGMQLRAAVRQLEKIGAFLASAFRAIGEAATRIYRAIEGLVASIATPRRRADYVLYPGVPQGYARLGARR
jgi:hypothetical protein